MNWLSIRIQRVAFTTTFVYSTSKVTFTRNVCRGLIMIPVRQKGASICSSYTGVKCILGPRPFFPPVNIRPLTIYGHASHKGFLLKTCKLQEIYRMHAHINEKTECFNMAQWVLLFTNNYMHRNQLVKTDFSAINYMNFLTGRNLLVVAECSPYLNSFASGTQCTSNSNHRLFDKLT